MTFWDFDVPGELRKTPGRYLKKNTDTDSAAFRFEGTYHVDLGIHCQKATTATPTMPNAVTFVVWL